MNDCTYLGAMFKHPYFQLFKYYQRANSYQKGNNGFIDDIIKLSRDSSSNSFLDRVEGERTRLLNDDSTIEFVEMGAGSHITSGSNRKTSKVAKSSLSGEWQCRFLYKLCNHLGAKEILEIGTSLGISTAYLSHVAESNITTMEGNPSSINVANDVFKRLNISNVNIIQGNFDVTLEPTVRQMKKIDCAFIDGNHRKKSTIDYFILIKEYCHSNSVIVVDDIYWSKGMNEAWSTIKNDSKVMLSLDFYYMGLVFLNGGNVPKGDYSFIDPRYKPFSSK